MGVRKRVLHAPVGPSPLTLQDADYTIIDEAGIRLVCYCPRNHAGCVYDFRGELWAIYRPIHLDGFLRSLEDRGIKLPQGPDLDRWLAAVSKGDIPEQRGRAN